MDFGKKMLAAAEKAGMKVSSSVPDTWLKPVIDAFTESSEIVHAPAAREEDALGICCGAALAGKRALCMMQSAGALNTGGTLATLANSYGIPLVLLISDRGHLGDVTIAHFEKARTFRPFLKALRIPHYDLTEDFLENDQLLDAFKMAEIGQKPVALLVTKKIKGD